MAIGRVVVVFSTVWRMREGNITKVSVDHDVRICISGVVFVAHFFARASRPFSVNFSSRSHFAFRQVQKKAGGAPEGTPHPQLPPLFDVLLIDEASQMPLARAALPVRFLKRTGRLVVAGDVLQLPPIIHAAW